MELLPSIFVYGSTSRWWEISIRELAGHHLGGCVMCCIVSKCEHVAIDTYIDVEMCVRINSPMDMTIKTNYWKKRLKQKLAKPKKENFSDIHMFMLCHAIRLNDHWKLIDMLIFGILMITGRKRRNKNKRIEYKLKFEPYNVQSKRKVFQFEKSRAKHFNGMPIFWYLKWQTMSQKHRWVSCCVLFIHSTFSLALSLTPALCRSHANLADIREKFSQVEWDNEFHYRFAEYCRFFFKKQIS